MSTKLFLALALSLCAAGGGFADPLEGMKNFGALKMANYSNYLTTNGLDPSPIYSIPQYFKASNQVANLSVTISNQKVRGHSNGISVKNIDSRIDEDFQYYHLIAVDFETSGNVTFFGDYALNGRVNSTIPITAEGLWHISVPVVYFNTCKTIFYSENSTSEIIVILSTVELHFGDEPVYDIFFENLFDNDDVIGLEEDIEEALFAGFSEYITATGEWTSQDPIKRLYIKYWAEVLRNTTLEEIYGTTMPSTKLM